MFDDAPNGISFGQIEPTDANNEYFESSLCFFNLHNSDFGLVRTSLKLTPYKHPQTYHHYQLGLHFYGI